MPALFMIDGKPLVCDDKLATSEDCCAPPAITCVNCSEDTDSPSQLQLIASGLVGLNSEFNGTYLLDFLGYVPGVTPYCAWGLDVFPATFGWATSPELRLIFNGPGDYQIDVNFGDASVGIGIDVRYRLTGLTSAPDCRSWSGLSIPYFAATIGGSEASTVLLSAV